MNSKPVTQAIGLSDTTSFLIENNYHFCATKPIRTNNDNNTCFQYNIDFKMVLRFTLWRLYA
jgi:hypothetical protein